LVLNHHWYLIIDGHCIPLGNKFKTAFNTLFKSFFVFNVEYPIECTSVYNFVESVVCKIQTKILSSVQALASALDKIY